MPRKKVEQQDDTISIALALKELCETKGLSEQVVIDAMSEALKKAYFKFSGDYPDTVVRVDIDLNHGTIKMAKIKNVVAEITDDVFETDPEEAYEETGVHYQIGDVIETPIDIAEFKRAAAMQAKSVFKQKLREAEKAVVINQYADKVGDVLPGVIDAVEKQHCIVKIGHTSAYLSKKNVLPGEPLKVGAPIKVYVEEVVKNAIGTPIIVSRTNPRFVTRLMEQDIAEISDGIVEIKGVARLPGIRSKVAVASKDPNIDPSGACIGPRGMRISRVLSQIPGEKIDVINYNENPLLYIADALKPAQVVGIAVLEDTSDVKSCRVIVPDEQYSLAIGKEAQNVNLAVRLTGWKIDIKSLRDAIAANYEYQNLEDIKFMEEAKKHAPIVSKQPKVEETKPEIFVEKVEEEPIVEEPVVETTLPSTKEFVPEPSVEEEPIVEKVTPTKQHTPNVFSELEAALNASSTANEETVNTKKKWTKKTEKVEVEEEPAKPTTPINVLPVYTEEELRALEEEEELEENNYDDEVDYDEFDEYYDK